MEYVEKNLQELRQFNDRLTLFQNKMIAQAKELDALLKKRTDDKNDCLYDYEIEIVVSFFLNEDDIFFDDDKDNIITTIYEHAKNISSDSLKSNHRWNDNHNEFRCSANHPMSGDWHCWWFHCLYDHNHISFSELLRIGSIWGDINVSYQYKN